MKMKLWDRLILRLGAVVTLVTGVLAILGGVRLLDMEVAEGKFHFVLTMLPTVLIVAGALTALVSLLHAAAAPLSSAASRVCCAADRAWRTAYRGERH